LLHNGKTGMVMLLHESTAKVKKNVLGR
jgi:hypothetical protein